MIFWYAGGMNEKLLTKEANKGNLPEIFIEGVAEEDKFPIDPETFAKDLAEFIRCKKIGDFRDINLSRSYGEVFSQYTGESDGLFDSMVGAKTIKAYFIEVPKLLENQRLSFQARLVFDHGDATESLSFNFDEDGIFLNTSGGIMPKTKNLDNNETKEIEK